MNAGGLLAILALLLLVAGGGLTWYRAEGTPPAFEAPERLVVGRAGVALELAAADLDSGLRSLRAAVVAPDGSERVLLEESYPGNLLSGGVRHEQTSALELAADALGDVPEGAVLALEVRDWSWRGGFGGNATHHDVPLRVDIEAPRIFVRSGLTYVRQGGSGSVAYQVSEPAGSDGVKVGDRVFSGHPLPGGEPGERIALFAVPADADPKAPVRVFAVDEAGNEATAGWSLVVQPHPQPEADVRLPGSFLTNVVPRLAGGAVTEDPAAAFHDVNTRVRAENEAKIREVVAASASEPLFEGSLRQLANSQVTSHFGEKRAYLVDGVEVSRATHYGYDLASHAAAPVTAAAAGRVLFADELGIYGNCVILDHGLGLTTLYGHLSRIDVEPGAQVAVEQRLGLTGATGLAGGDHLHFAVLVGDTYVDPLEWWDAKWVTTHVDTNLRKPGP